MASSSFKAAIGKVYTELKGKLGAGNKISVICADPHVPIPEILQSPSAFDDDEVSPAPSIFFRASKDITESMGFSSLLGSNTEAPLISFMYEIFRNTVEHGIPNKGRVGRSTRAIFFEKIVLRQPYVKVKGISEGLGGYLERIASKANMPTGLGVLCISIVDQGDGISSTLPANKGESSREIFARAFLEGESRKPIGIIKRGLGLPIALASAKQLGVMIHIFSGRHSFTKDFSSSEEREEIGADQVVESGLKIDIGTVVTIYLPEYLENPDQI